MSKYLILLLISFSAWSGTLVTNKDHSEIMFQISYMGVSELTGRFNEFKGELSQGDKILESLNVTIKSQSIDTGNKMRDGHLRDHDFFKSRQHPEIKFISHKIVPAGKNSYKAIGKLSLKGVTKDHAVDFSLTDPQKDTWGYENRFVKFRTAINRKDYNILWNKTLSGEELLIGDDVKIWGTFQLQPVAKVTPNSKHMIPDTEEIRKRDQEKQNESGLSKKLRNLINGK